MIIGGIQKLSLLDFPDHTCCTIFTQGCNFRCPYCHNATLLENTGGQSIAVGEIFDFLKSRQGLLDGVCISGGEPLAQPGLAAFIMQIKELGFLVKLDTNGSFPERLKHLIDNTLVDYVAMDIKSSPENYSAAAGMRGIEISAVMESAALLIKSSIPYEFRTTIVRELHTETDLESIGRWLRGAQRYFLQSFAASDNVLSPGLSPCSLDEMQQLLETVRPYIPNAQLRGV